MTDILFDCVKTVNFEMDYFRFGGGEKTMVILPGLSVQSVMGAARAVAEEYAVMRDDFTVYLFDRRKNLPARYSVYDMAKDTAEAMQSLGLRELCLFGASQGGMTPEAAAGGLIGLIQDGDMINVDITNRTLTLEVDDAEIEKRRAAWVAPEKHLKGYLARYYQHVSSGSQGAVFLKDE